MTTENLYNLAETSKLGQNVSYAGYCIAAAVDSSFNRIKVPLAVYEANQVAYVEGEVGQEGEATDKFYHLLGRLAFEDEDPASFMHIPYYFTTLEELVKDLSKLRGKKTILLDTCDQTHSVGLKPVGDNPDNWQIVGTHQIVAVQRIGEPIEFQGMIKPETITTEQVWEYLLANNSPDATIQTAMIFPVEPV